VKRGSLIIWALTGAVLIAAVAVALLLLMPALARLDAATTRAEQSAAVLAQLEKTAVGQAYERDVAMFAARRLEKVEEVETARADLANRLYAPFGEMKIAEGATAPSFDEFQRAYNFHGDQLRNRIRDLVGRSGGPEAREIPLMIPPFGAGPMDEATMARWQRAANVEARVLETAAKSGAPPAAVLSIEADPPPPDDPDAGYERLRIGAELLCPEGKTSPLVHSLLACFDEHGGITKVLGLIETPVPEARLRERTGPPCKRVSLALSLGFPSLRGSASR
jgi:hypothetical protein